MKKAIYKSLLLFLVLVATPALAGEPNYEFKKEKTISKVFLVNSNAGVDITNKYGNIYVTTWNEDKIGLDIVIRVSGKKEEKVDQRLNSISVDINALKSKVSATTVFGSFSGNNISMEINYTIKMPKDGNVDLSNQYGSITVGNTSGNTDITCKYGSVSLGELNGESNQLKIQYCDGSKVSYVKNGSVDAKYSGLSITKASNLVYNSAYTNLNLKDVNNVTYNADYGDVIIGSANNVDGNGDYLKIKLGTVSSNLQVNTNYSALSVSNITSKANNVAISASYTNINLKHDANFTYDFEFNLKYANLEAPEYNYQSKRQSTTSAYYKGNYKNGSKKLSVNSNYGNVQISVN